MWSRKAGEAEAGCYRALFSPHQPSKLSHVFPENSFLSNKSTLGLTEAGMVSFIVKSNIDLRLLLAVLYAFHVAVSLPYFVEMI